MFDPSDRQAQVIWKNRPGSNTSHAKGYGARNFIALCSVDVTSRCMDPGKHSRRCRECVRKKAERLRKLEQA